MAISNPKPIDQTISDKASNEFQWNAEALRTIDTDSTGAYKGNRISTTSFNSRDSATLAAAATFQGTGEDISAYGRVGVSITSTTATATGTVTMEVSHDNSNWSGPTRTWKTYDAPLMWNIVEQYFRIKFVNDAVEAANFAVQVQYSNNADIVLGHQVGEILPANTEAQAVRPTNDFDLDTSRVHIKGQSSEFFFGENNTVGTDFEDVYPPGGDIQWQTTAAKIKIKSTDATDDSGREVSKIVGDSRTNTTDGQYFDITAQDATTYRVYMDTTGADATQPADGGRTLTKVDIFTGVADTAAGSADAVALVLGALSDFVSAITGDGTIYVTDANAGNATDIANGDLGNAWAVSVDTAGATAGVGVHSVEVHGLDSTGHTQDEVIFMNGITPVESNLSYLRVTLVHNEEVGTYGGSHEGTVEWRVTNATFGSGALLGQMTGLEGVADSGPQFGYGEAQNGFTSVPHGKVLYITRIEVIPKTAKSINIALYEREGITTVTSPYLPRRVIWSADEIVDPVEKEFKSHIKIKGLTDLWFRVEGTGGAANGVAVWCDYYLVDADSDGA